MLVKDRIKRKNAKIVAVAPDTDLSKAMELMLNNNVRCLPVVDGSGKLLGIVDDKDIFRAVHADNDGFRTMPVSKIMTEDLIIGLPDDEINYIAGLMTKNNIRYVPIMDGEKIAGLISRSDVIRSQRRHSEITNRYLKLYMEGTQHG
jgi:CBS domain-containing protein